MRNLYQAALQALIADFRSWVGDPNAVWTVSKLPTIGGTYTCQSIVDAAIAAVAAADPNVHLIDRSGFDYPDGLHLDAAGQYAWADLMAQQAVSCQ